MIRPSLRLSLLVLPVLLAGACSDETPNVPADAATSGADAALPDAAPPTDGATADATAADSTGADAVESGMPGETTGVGLVVVHGDYKTSLISLVDPATGTLTHDDCLDSGSKPAGLTTTLSGDVVVPSQAQPGNQVLLIDRQNATLTWVAPATCTVSRQLNVGEGKNVNPQDVIGVSASKAYVTRYNKVASDLLVIDPSAGTLGKHIDLLPSAPLAGGQAVLPNPSRGVISGGKVYVLLTALSEDTKVGANGRIVVIDPASDTVTSTIDLPGVKNCGSISAVGGALVVSCGGLFGDANMLADSGVAVVDPRLAPPSVKVVGAKDIAGRALSPFDVAARSASLAFAISGGDFSGTPPDELWAFDFVGSAPKKLFSASAAFTLSGLLVDRRAQKLFVADANMMTPRLHVFDLSPVDGPVLQTSLVTAAGGLPPRYVGWY
jgi:hypothetical protein